MRLEEWKQIPLFMYVQKGRIFLANIEEKVEELVMPYIKNLGYSLYDVEYVKERKRLFPQNLYRRWNRNRRL